MNAAGIEQALILIAHGPADYAKQFGDVKNLSVDAALCTFALRFKSCHRSLERRARKGPRTKWKVFR
jgi:hypothetical protein